jgi:hypothetical protein
MSIPQHELQFQLFYVLLIIQTANGSGEKVGYFPTPCHWLLVKSFANYMPGLKLMDTDANAKTAYLENL